MNVVNKCSGFLDSSEICFLTSNSGNGSTTEKSPDGIILNSLLLGQTLISYNPLPLNFPNI